MTELRVDWRWLVALLVVSVLFVPARIYVLPVALPFEVDLYRVLLGALLCAWLLSLLADSTVRMRTTGLEAPLGLLVVAIVGSLVVNPSRIALYQAEVIKTLAIFVSLILTLYLTVSVVRRLETAEWVLRTLVLGGAILGVLALVESRTGWTPFGSLDRYLPFLDRVPTEGELERGTHFRAFGSAGHPIALGALLAMLAPISAALAVRARSVLWWAALAALVVGAVSTVSRTAVVMLVAGFALFCALRWDEAKRFVPLALAVMAGIHLLVPGTLGTLRQGLVPSSVAVEQRSNPESRESAGRIADLGPSFEEFQRKPLLGYAPGTRIVIGERANARLLDNQWLGSLLDLGLVGVIALIWLFARFIGRIARASASAASHDAVLLAALAASVFAYAVGMFLYDSFAFVQVTLVFFMVLAVGCSLALAPGRIFEALPEPIVAPERVRRQRFFERLARRRARHRQQVVQQLERTASYTAGRHGPPPRDRDR
jgi:hypothetical protein